MHSKQIKPLLTLFVAIVVLAGRIEAQDTASPLPSVTLPPALDRVLRDYERLWRAGDATALSTLFTADGFVLSNGKQPVRGRDAIARIYQGQSGPLALRAFAFATADTVGYIVGGYSYTPAQGDQGKFTLTLRRGSDGRWLIASDMDNFNSPPRPQRPPGAPL
jgi:ketosteroid isomerase-like protein